MSICPPSDEPGGRGSSPNSEIPEISQQKLNSMLAGIWERSKKTIEERAAVLREAQVLAAKNRLDAPARLRAVDAAHKLAGVLGTFGLPRGTELAREAEETFGREGILSSTVIDRLDALVVELDSLIRTAGPSTRG